MSVTAVELSCDAPVERLWSVLTDLPGTTAPVPLTTASGDPGPPHLGWGFTARTGVGPLGFDDTMLVTSLRPPADGAPGTVRVVKVGRLLDGWAEMTAVPDGPERSVLRWREQVGPRPPVLRALTPARLQDAATAVLLRRMAGDVVARAAGAHRAAGRA